MSYVSPFLRSLPTFLKKIIPVKITITTVYARECEREYNEQLVRLISISDHGDLDSAKRLLTRLIDTYGLTDELVNISKILGLSDK